jgi:hypothetical protein
MAVDQTRYRQLEFIGAKILQARELNWVQEISQGVAVIDNETPVDGQLQPLFRQGATYNIKTTISGLTVTLSSNDGVNPMMIFVRDRWELFPRTNDDCTDSLGTNPGNHSITLTNIETVVYLNWELRIRTGGPTGDDPTLTDALSNEAVASGGELILHLSHTDTSNVALSASQLAKNTGAIPLLTFTNTGTALVLVPIDNVFAQAQGNTLTSGLVKTTTNNPTVVSTDDSRMSNNRGVIDGSVHDSSVRTPIAAGGVNADGTPTYNLVGDVGGISAAKLIYIAGTQLVSDFIGWIRTGYNNLLTRYNLHEGNFLGLTNTHPLPTAAQVGAAPLSHVGQALGLSTSHPPVVNVNSGGFVVNSSGFGNTVNDPAFGLWIPQGLAAGLNHNGDVYSSLANGWIATPGGSLLSGRLGSMALVAAVLSQHVNQISHANPHGLAAADIGAATTGYVDTSVANILAAAENYTNSKFSNGFALSKNTNGYLILPVSLGSLIFQWGFNIGSSGGTFISFPIIFPNNLFSIVVTGNAGSANAKNVSRSGFYLDASSLGNGAWWMAIGY